MMADLEVCRIETEMRMHLANIARDKACLRRLTVELLLHLVLRHVRTRKEMTHEQ